ncbi:right-handed parallel beta-helix repeat-containing protein [Geodermatophilus sp. YIM 151500]|uniref:right-handed parallel beta-helix repeat-containing protein n=1 Tax=Geodermatophilus sp. YIM 151500 TaxID=2984531 RepID=UPI0021E4CC90|nr:right-handed parallel beta-helix repeat-containing protein [Geodermatophilus sp. YIM 151500]MCV2490662.1 right-handed parallel beta-helix repeat-containing protein [Geodermatophilus sp. YIM 151500]
MIRIDPSPAPPVACVVAAAVLLAGCGVAEGASTASDQPCSVTAADQEALEQALVDAGPGSRICVTGGLLEGTDVALQRSGEPGRPVVVVSQGAQVRSVVVEADHVVVQGFVTYGGEGIVLSGRDLVARDNEVRAARENGISCEDGCADVVIEDNTVLDSDGSGVLVEGRRIIVQRNRISGSVQREAGDADGIRFFGSGIRILGNTITDIKDDGYEGEPPHTDCFQTFDNSRMPTVDAVIADNVCRDVDHQCLIATAQEAGTTGRLGRSRDIEFTGNECHVEGAQAVLVQWFPDVVLRDNSFAGPNLHRGAIYLDGSTNGAFFRNVVPDRVPPYELDEKSDAGFSTDEPN